MRESPSCNPTLDEASGFFETRDLFESGGSAEVRKGEP
jgi:hypothetical protein